LRYATLWSVPTYNIIYVYVYRRIHNYVDLYIIRTYTRISSPRFRRRTSCTSFGRSLTGVNNLLHYHSIIIIIDTFIALCYIYALRIMLGERDVAVDWSKSLKRVDLSETTCRLDRFIRRLLAHAHACLWLYILI